MADSRNILIALSNAETRSILAFAVESRTGAAPYEAGTAKAAIEALADHGAIRTVICEYPGISDVLFRHLVSLNRARAEADQIRCIVCSGQKPEAEKDAVLQKMNILGFAPWPRLIDATLDLLAPPDAAASPLPDADRELVDANMCRIRTSLLIRVGPLRTPVYIRLSATKYVKLFQTGDVFDENDYRRILREKKLEHLYLRQDGCGEFLLKFKLELLSLLQSETAGAAPEEFLEAVHETSQELLEKIGATPEVQALVKDGVQLAIKTMGKSPRLADILGRLQVDREKYISSHSMLLPRIACALAIAMDWKSEPTLQKLSLAAFLHDSTLTSQALAAVRTSTELARRKDQFTEEEAKAFKLHPVKAAEIVKQFHEIPPDVDAIVLQHHERPDGTGFPRGLGPSNISPLAAVFIVAHDLVSAIFDASVPFVLEEFLEAKKEEYHGGNFRKLLAHLSQLKL